MERIRNWFNHGRKYFEGVVLLGESGGKASLCAILAKGETRITRKRLEKELAALLQPENAVKQLKAVPTAVPDFNKHILSKQPNQDLYEAAKLEADKAYRANQNLRAELFALAEPRDFSDPNTDDRVAARSALALQVVTGYQAASGLYEKADYIAEHGRLPVTEDQEEAPNPEGVPDENVYTVLTNRRKALSKLKKKPVTPERMERMQEHQHMIDVLAQRWEKLKTTDNS